jgi:hypothetical protein
MNRIGATLFTGELLAVVFGIDVPLLQVAGEAAAVDPGMHAVAAAEGGNLLFAHGVTRAA